MISNDFENYPEPQAYLDAHARHVELEGRRRNPKFLPSPHHVHDMANDSVLPHDIPTMISKMHCPVFIGCSDCGVTGCRCTWSNSRTVRKTTYRKHEYSAKPNYPGVLCLS